MEQTVFSVIIPTKNRHNQLLKTIDAHKFWPQEVRDKVELVIADNSDISINDMDILKITNIFNNVIYKNEVTQMTISENFSRGLKMSNSKWIIFIGDDDFFMPQIVEFLEKKNVENYDCIVYNPHKYYWDTCVFLNENVKGSPSALVKAQPWKEEIVDAEYELRKSLINGGLTIEKMPRLYHGLVKKKIAEKLLLTEDQELILGSPDISMATILSCMNLRVLATSESLSIYGASEGSGGGMTTSKTHATLLEKASFLSNSFRSQWDKRIPGYWSEYTVFPASIIYVSQMYNLILPRKINFSAIHLTCLLNEFHYNKFVLSSICSLRPTDLINYIALSPYSLIRKIFGKFFRIIYNNKGNDDILIIQPAELFKHS